MNDNWQNGELLSTGYIFIAFFIKLSSNLGWELTFMNLF